MRPLFIAVLCMGGIASAIVVSAHDACMVKDLRLCREDAQQCAAGGRLRHVLEVRPLGAVEAALDDTAAAHNAVHAWSARDYDCDMAIAITAPPRAKATCISGPTSRPMS